jgi:hypothetical protein
MPLKDLKSIFREMLQAGEDVATCPSCSLMVSILKMDIIEIFR